MIRQLITSVLAVALVGAAPALLPAQGRQGVRTTADLTALDLEQLMQLEVVFAASKRDQNPREIASVVTVVTAKEIEKNGYRTLGDILRTVASFYVSYDRNYSYVGVRGFAQPGDYNSRVLVLVDGLRTNDNVYDMAYVGDEFVVDPSMMERVEIVRGPSGAVYGSSAFFAVINVVTKKGSTINGTEVSGTMGTLGSHDGRVSFGKQFANGLDVVFSASAMKAEGAEKLYFPEFDDSTTNNGVAVRADAEAANKLLAKLTWKDFTLSATRSSREKVVPTASFATLFNDARYETLDQTSLASLSYARASELGSVSGRVHAGKYRYAATYPFVPAVAPNFDDVDGRWWGVDFDASRSLFGRHRLTTGFEYRDNYKQNQLNYDPEPFTSYVDQRYTSQRLGAFFQDQVKLSNRVILYAGLRHDWFETFGTATSPRLGLIFNPDSATSLKLLQGNAFRAPNEYELHYNTGDNYTTHGTLGPERIETLELAGDRRFGTDLRLTASLFRNKITDLITLQTDTAGLLYFENSGRIDSKGVEAGLEWNPGRGMSGEVSYAWQKTADRETDSRLTNSPAHSAKLKMFAPLVAERLSVGIDAHYVGERKTLAGGRAAPFTLTNLTLLAPAVARYLDLSVSAYNLFNTRYTFPGSEEHLQDQIVQDGRTLRFRATFKY